jgi:hypothetical protein
MEMKWPPIILALSCLTACSQILTLGWTLPTNQVSPNVLFRLFGTTNPKLPYTSWPVISTAWLTNCQVKGKPGAFTNTVKAPVTGTWIWRVEASIPSPPFTNSVK